MSVDTQMKASAAASLSALRREDGAATRNLFGPVPRNDAELLALAKAHPPRRELRRAALDLLEPAWTALDLPQSSCERATRLRDAETLIVIAGQQPALCGGPLYVYAKALSAARLARRLTRLGVEAEALFWIGDDDHDTGELFAGGFPAPDGSLRELSNPFPAGRIPLGELRFAAGGPQSLIASVREFLPHGAATASTIERLERTMDLSPSRWFQRFLVDLLAAEGILPVTPAMLRPASAPWFAAELALPGTLAAQVAGANERLRGLGVAPTITKADAVPLFLHDAQGARHRLDAVSDGVRLRNGSGTTLPLSEVIHIAETSPQRISPDALFRPLVQDAVLAPFAAIVGPTEMGYHLQLADAYRERGIVRPLLMPRVEVRVLERELVERLHGAGIDPAAIDKSTHPARLVPSGDAAREGAELARELERFIASVDRVARGPRATNALARRAERLTRRWKEDVAKLIDAMQREIVEDEVAPARALAGSARNALWPGGEAAERSISVLHFLAVYGDSVLAAIGDAYDPYDARERLIALAPLGEMKG